MNERMLGCYIGGTLRVEFENLKMRRYCIVGTLVQGLMLGIIIEAGVQADRFVEISTAGVICNLNTDLFTVY